MLICLQSPVYLGHGGYMEVYSWEGIGSKFTVVLPPEQKKTT